MEDNKSKPLVNHSIYVENRERAVISEVRDVKSFDEETVLLDLQQGGIIIKGKDLQVQSLDLDTGAISITGTIDSAVYTEKKDKQGKWFERLLK